MPVNFHIGASQTSFNMFGTASWNSMDMSERLALGSATLFFDNARVLGNLLYSGILERFPKVKVVSVESGIGWIPFLLETLDYEAQETGSYKNVKLKMLPSEYFRRQVYGCFWFETNAPQKLIQDVGVNNVLFETDFPHPTCLYPQFGRNKWLFPKNRFATNVESVKSPFVDRTSLRPQLLCSRKKDSKAHRSLR